MESSKQRSIYFTTFSQQNQRRKILQTWKLDPKGKFSLWINKQNMLMTSNPQPDQSDPKQLRKPQSSWFNGSTSAARVPPFVFERIGGDGQFSLLPRRRQRRRRWNEVHRSLRREFSHYCGDYMMEIKYSVHTHTQRIYWSY